MKQYLIKFYQEGIRGEMYLIVGTVTRRELPPSFPSFHGRVVCVCFGSHVKDIVLPGTFRYC